MSNRRVTLEQALERLTPERLCEHAHPNTWEQLSPKSRAVLLAVAKRWLDAVRSLVKVDVEAGLASRDPK